MTDHYYTRNPSSNSKPKTWSFSLKGYPFQFKTDTGVFSKNEVDYGSRLLIDTFVVPDIEGPLLDIGCGYGPIGLALARSLPNRFIHMIDINERAVSLAKENAVNNSVRNVQIYESDGFSSVNEKKFACILTNPPIRAGKKVVFDILERSYEFLSPEGEIWVVIQKKQGAPSVKNKLQDLYGFVEVVKKDKGYYILKGKKV